MKIRFRRVLSALLAAAVSAGALAGCSSGTETSSSSGSSSSVSSSEASGEESGDSVPLVYATGTFNQKFNPFFYTLAYDGEVASVCVDTLLESDREGVVVYDGLGGETREYNGTDYTYEGLATCTVDQGEETTTYTFQLREGVLFADGEELTADDLIFSLYVILDPTFTGIQTLYSEDIVGLNAYRTQTSDAAYEEYGVIFDGIAAGGSDYDQALLDSYAELVAAAWTDDLSALVASDLSSYAGYIEEYTGFTADEVSADEGLQIAFSMVLDETGTIADGVLTTVTGEAFDLSAGETPAIGDFYEASYSVYGGDAAAYYEAEGVGSSTVLDAAKEEFILANGQDESGEGVPNISGIQKIDDYTVSVTTNGFSATTIYKLASVPLAPLHYYGDESLYDYENNQFGFTYGDLSSIEDNLEPMGTGPYLFDRYENRTLYLSANENYWKGAPKIKQMQWRETNPDDQIAAVATGTADLTAPESSLEAYDEVRSYNSNGENTGDTLTMAQYAMNGYGLIGINSTTVNVGGVQDSEASKNLRRAFATILAVYRDIAISSYYGDGADVIEYSLTSVSWASPQPTDPGYSEAFSTDVNGDPIYTSDMTDEERYDAALQAAIGFFQAAGYTWDEASGTFTAAPEGAKLSYEMIVPGSGTGTHPDFMLAEYARDALAEIGITLVINDPSDTNVLWNALDAGTQEIWCQSWASGNDPDMYQIWHSNNAPGKPGSTGSNHASLEDPELDALILEGRTSSDTSFRKAIYTQCLDIIRDWAVEVPVFQRNEFFLFSTERVNVDTITPDITSYWDWMNDLEKLEMNG